ncbi:MAG: cupin domain-containing protein [Oligoflexia bacterium]|nr:cupin domain-containing protein [Oligoflexia bacterium]
MVKELIELLGMQAHPEGGYFKETYRSPIVINDRNCSTAIYYMLTKGSVAKFHTIKSDEIWHFYSGGSVKLVYFSNDGDLAEVVIGNNILEGEVPQFVIPANTNFAAFPLETTEYALLGCTVAPGFDYRDWELITREKLLKKYPKHKEIIERLT